MVIHHIDPNGPNSEDNGIPLCFDCHSDVRAYDPAHPVGRKFTPSELKKHRDQWFNLCSKPPFAPRQFFKPSVGKPPFDPQVFGTLVTEDIEPASKLVSQFISKPDVRDGFIKEVLKQIGSESEETRWKMAHVVEQIIFLDPSLISPKTLEEMASDDSFSVRSSAAVCYYHLAMANPSSVPIQTILKLANDPDWYVYTPAIQCLKVMAKSRHLVLEIFIETLNSHDPSEREIGANAIVDISEVEPWLLKPYKKEIMAHLQDNNENIVETTRKILSNMKKTPKKHIYPLM